MHIYFSGIGGVGIGPLIQIARDAGHEVSGSDLRDSAMTEQLRAEGIEVALGQDGTRIAEVHAERPIDWFVYTAALKEGKPELDFCESHGIRTSKRDGLLAEIIREKQLKLIAVSGTHGKTTTTGMFVWALKQLEIPISYSVGSTLSYGPSGEYVPGSEYFVYECDEFDRNMLQFEPHLSVITSLDYDHFDTYPTVVEYRQAFVQFIEQSDYTLLWEKDLRYLAVDPRADLEAYDELKDLSYLTLPGDHVRHNAFLVEQALRRTFPGTSTEALKNAINSFPGTGRRMEQIAKNLYSDYAHHPIEIAATLQLARELNDHIVAVYQPHQNIRQHEVRDSYRTAFELAENVYWLPTYLSREDSALVILSANELSAPLAGRATVVELDQTLIQYIEQAQSDNKLVLCMGAGDLDAWVRQHFADKK